MLSKGSSRKPSELDVGMKSKRIIALRGLSRGQKHWGVFPQTLNSLDSEIDLELLEIPGNGTRASEDCPIGTGGTFHATDTERRHRQHRLAARIARVPPPRSSRARRAILLLAAARSSGVRPAENGRSRAQSAVIGDHAEAHRDAKPGAGNRLRQIAARQLPNGLN